MSSQNIPCTNPELCKVKTHLPGTQALCQTSKSSNRGASASLLHNLTKNASTSDDDASKAKEMWSDPEFHFDGRSPLFGNLSMEGRPPLYVTRSGGVITLNAGVFDESLHADDYLSEDDLKYAVKTMYREMTAEYVDPKSEIVWPTNRAAEHENLVQKSSDTNISRIAARFMVEQSLRNGNATSENRGRIDATILENLAGNPGVESDVLDQIAKSPFTKSKSTGKASELEPYEIRAKLAVTQHPNVATKTLRDMAANSDNAKVKSAARKALKTSGANLTLGERMRGLFN